VSAPGLIVECPRPSAAERPCDIAGSEMPVAVSGMTTLRPKVSMCRCEGSPSPDELSSTRVRLYSDLSMSCDSIRARALTSLERDGHGLAIEFDFPPEELMDALAVMGLALGMRHGTDPDHLAAIDGLTRIRQRTTNGIYFALGHALVVMLLAMGIGHFLASRLAFAGPWSLIVIGLVNLWRLLRGAAAPRIRSRPIVVQPLLLGMLLAAGFETASQLSALILAGLGSAWVLGVAFSFGMVLVDGLDGYLAGSTQRLAAMGQTRAKAASRALGIIVVIFAFGLGGAELFGIELTSVALPLGLSLFVIVIGLRIWARSIGPTGTDAEISGVEMRGQIG